jgi:BON domain-containing protein
MERRNKGERHPAVEEFEKRTIGTSPTKEDRTEPLWPKETKDLYGHSPEYLAPGPEADPQYRGERQPHDIPVPERIRNDVLAALGREPELDAKGVTVEVNAERDVTLGGEVGHMADKRLAEDLAADVRGLHQVHNHIRVRGAGA